MNTLAKGLALFVAVTCAVWVAVLWRWRRTSFDMTEFDIVIFLILLPLLVFALGWWLRRAWRHSGARHEARMAASAGVGGAAPTAVGAIAASPAEDASRHAPFILFSAHVASGAGSGVTALLEAAYRNEPRPALDPELRDDNGFALLTSRVRDLDVDAVTAELRSLVERQQPPIAGPAVRDLSRSLVRALAALLAPLGATLQVAVAEIQRVDGSGAGQGSVTGPPRVRILAGWPLEWNEFERAIAHAWLQATISEHRSALAVERFDIEAPAGDADVLWRHADQLLRTLDREERNDLVLLVACHSDIDETRIRHLQAQRRLLSVSANPTGLIPGEGAAALLLATARWTAAPDADASAVLLHQAVMARRDKSIEAPGRVKADLLSEIARRALSVACVDASDVASLFCDADQHSARSAELFAAKAEVLDHLDSTEDLRRTGPTTGHLGAVGALLVVACAAECARLSGSASLAISLGDPHVRLALLACPQHPPERSAPTSNA